MQTVDFALCLYCDFQPYILVIPNETHKFSKKKKRESQTRNHTKADKRKKVTFYDIVSAWLVYTLKLHINQSIL